MTIAVASIVHGLGAPYQSELYWWRENTLHVIPHHFWNKLSIYEITCEAMPSGHKHLISFIILLG